MDETLDFSQDYEVPVGTDFVFDFTWQPLDLTGCTCSLVADFGTLSVSVNPTGLVYEGDDPVSELKVTVSHTTTSTLTSGSVYNWKLLTTFTDGTIQRMGHGVIVAL